MNLSEKLVFLLSLLTSKLLNGFTNPKSIRPKRILIVKLDEIGDMVNTVHVFELLKKQYPTAEITVWCKPFCKKLIENDPHLYKVVTAAQELSGRYDLIADLRGTFQTIAIAWKNLPRYRVDRGTIRLRNKLAGGHPHEVSTNYQIIEPLLHPAREVKELTLQLYPSQEAIAKAASFIQDCQLGRFAVIHMGARRELRRWPAQQFVALANYLQQEKKLALVFAGDQSDLALIEQVQQALSFATYTTAQQLNLMEFAAVLQQASLFVGNESGPLHIAAAMQVPVVGLFGPGEPTTFYPYGAKSRYVHHVLECNPCDQIHCVHPDAPCIQRITLAEVVEKIAELGI